VLSDYARGGVGFIGPAPIGRQQAAGFQHHAGGAAGIRRRGEGNDEASLRAIAAARQDNISIDVSGLDEFDIADFSNELDDAGKLLSLGIESETLKKQVFKKLAFKFLSDVRQEIKTQIAQEIDRPGTQSLNAQLLWRQERGVMEDTDVQAIVKQAIQEFFKSSRPRANRPTRRNSWRNASAASNWSGG
jgi:hypothetical protein